MNNIRILYSIRIAIAVVVAVKEAKMEALVGYESDDGDDNVAKNQSNRVNISNKIVLFTFRSIRFTIWLSNSNEGQIIFKDILKWKFGIACVNEHNNIV